MARGAGAAVGVAAMGAQAVEAGTAAPAVAAAIEDRAAAAVAVEATEASAPAAPAARAATAGRAARRAATTNADRRTADGTGLRHGVAPRGQTGAVEHLRGAIRTASGDGRSTRASRAPWGERPALVGTCGPVRHAPHVPRHATTSGARRPAVPAAATSAAPRPDGAPGRRRGRPAAVLLEEQPPALVACPHVSAGISGGIRSRDARLSGSCSPSAAGRSAKSG